MLVVLIIALIVETILLTVTLFNRKRIQYDGSLVVTETSEKKQFSLEIDVDPDTLDQRKQIVLLVKLYSK